VVFALGTAGGFIANATALTGVVVALAAALAVSSPWFLEPVLISLQGHDPCAASKGYKPLAAAIRGRLIRANPY
jgi:hypothetical protein